MYYTLKLVKLQILEQPFQCWCYSYPTSTCLMANTLTSARATSVLTHLINSDEIQKGEFEGNQYILQYSYKGDNL